MFSRSEMNIEYGYSQEIEEPYSAPQYLKALLSFNTKNFFWGSDHVLFLESISLNVLENNCFLFDIM